MDTRTGNSEGTAQPSRPGAFRSGRVCQRRRERDSPPQRLGPPVRSITASAASSACMRSCATTSSAASSTDAGAAAVTTWRSVPDAAAVLLVGYDYLVKAGSAACSPRNRRRRAPSRRRSCCRASAGCSIGRGAISIALSAAWRACLGAASVDRHPLAPPSWRCWRGDGVPRARAHRRPGPMTARAFGIAVVTSA